MAKRFLGTELFDDPWYVDLSKDAKILWIYVITKCNHAGVIQLSEKLCVFQTGIEDVQNSINELGDRLYKISEHLYFIPKFIPYQYPNFPNSKVKAQESAIAILEKYKLFDKGLITLNQPLPNPYGNGNGSVYGKGNNTVNDVYEVEIDD